MPACQTAGVDRRQPVIPPATTAPGRVFSQDDSRFGCLTVRRRRLTARGVPPRGRGHHVCAWCYVDGAVEPTTGDRVCLAWPSLNADGFQRFVEAVAAACPDRLHLLGRAHSGAPTAPRLVLPANVRRVGLPPYGPELHPLERVWRDRKDALAWRQFPPLDGQQDSLATLLQG